MADSDSGIAWHRARIKHLREALRELEAGADTVTRTAPTKKTRRAGWSIADLKRKIRQSEQIVEAYDRRHIKRPRGTDPQSLAGVRAS